MVRRRPQLASSRPTFALAKLSRLVGGVLRTVGLIILGGTQVNDHPTGDNLLVFHVDFGSDTADFTVVVTGLSEPIACDHHRVSARSSPVCASTTRRKSCWVRRLRVLSAFCSCIVSGKKVVAILNGKRAVIA